MTVINLVDQEGTYAILKLEACTTEGHVWLADPNSARAIGERARERVRDRSLGDRHLKQYASLLGSLAV